MKVSEAYRCSICPAVSDPALRNNPDDPVCVIFHPDPKNPFFYICEDCTNGVNSALEDFYEEEEMIFNYPF